MLFVMGASENGSALTGVYVLVVRTGAIVHLNVVLLSSKFLWIPGLVFGVLWDIGRILIRLVNFCVPFGSLSGLTGISLIPISRSQRSRRNDNRHLLGTAEISDLSAWVKIDLYG